MEPLILHIETSSHLCSTALSLGDQVIAVVTSDTLHDHSATLAPMIQRMLSSQNLTPGSLDAVAVSIGPGSYTGLRVGLSTAKAICYAASRPLIAVDTLQSLAWSVRATLGNPSHNIYVPVLDARRQDAYMGVFGVDGTRMAEDRFLTVTADCLEPVLSVGQKVVICGEGTSKWLFFQDRQWFQVIPFECKAQNLVLPAFLSFEKEDFADLSACVPKYLKPPHITIPA